MKRRREFHCCASCEHFRAAKLADGGMEYRCNRLGYETKPVYQFQCWSPKDSVKRLMEKERKE